MPSDLVLLSLLLVSMVAGSLADAGRAARVGVSAGGFLLHLALAVTWIRESWPSAFLAVPGAEPWGGTLMLLVLLLPVVVAVAVVPALLLAEGIEALLLHGITRAIGAAIGALAMWIAVLGWIKLRQVFGYPAPTDLTPFQAFLLRPL